MSISLELTEQEDGHVRVRVGDAEGVFAVRGNRLIPISDERVFRELEQVRDSLLTILKPDRIESWVYAPNSALGDISPRDAVEAGKVEEVLELIARVANGTHT